MTSAQGRRGEKDLEGAANLVNVPWKNNKKMEHWLERRGSMQWPSVRRGGSEG